MKHKNDEFSQEDYHPPPVHQVPPQMQQPNVNVSINAPYQKPAGFEWVLAGIFLGVIGWIIALVTDKGDGRGGKALGGCLLGPILALAVLFLLGLGAS